MTGFGKKSGNPLPKQGRKALAKRPDRDFLILREVGKALTSTLELKQVLKKIMEIIAGIFKPKNWSLLLLDYEKKELYFEIAVGEGAEELKGIRLKVDEGIAGYVVRTRQSLVVENAYQDPRFARWIDEKNGFQAGAIICVPLVYKEKILGVIELFEETGKKFSSWELEILEALADFIAVAIENARIVAKIKRYNIIDDITGLYNSRYLHPLLEMEISRSQRHNQPFALIFADLDYFKLVNDRYGHLAGSRILKEVGKLFRSNLRRVSWVLRYGGDEFIFILPGTDRQEAILVCRRLRRVLNNACFLEAEGKEIKLTASFGIALFPENGDEKETIIKQADQAMYLVKNTGRDGIALAGRGRI